MGQIRQTRQFVEIRNRRRALCWGDGAVSAISNQLRLGRQYGFGLAPQQVVYPGFGVNHASACCFLPARQMLTLERNMALLSRFVVPEQFVKLTTETLNLSQKFADRGQQFGSVGADLLWGSFRLKYLFNEMAHAQVVRHSSLQPRSIRRGAKSHSPKRGVRTFQKFVRFDHFSGDVAATIEVVPLPRGAARELQASCEGAFPSGWS